MKNLLKISLVFAFALFVSMSVKAQAPVNGTITTTVTDYLQFGSLTPNVNLTYNESTSSFGSQTVSVPVQASCDWAINVIAIEGVLAKPAAPSVTLPLSSVLLSETNTTSASLSNTAAFIVGGSRTMTKVITFTLQNLHNEYAGEYKATIVYSLVHG